MKWKNKRKHPSPFSSSIESYSFKWSPLKTINKWAQKQCWWHLIPFSSLLRLLLVDIFTLSSGHSLNLHNCVQSLIIERPSGSRFHFLLLFIIEQTHPCCCWCQLASARSSSGYRRCCLWVYCFAPLPDHVPLQI